MKALQSKLFIIGVVLVVGVVADQATKMWAEGNLATPRYPDHQVIFDVGSDYDGETLETFLAGELISTAPDELVNIGARWATRDGAPLRPGQLVREGDLISLQQRSITVVDGYWDYVYARNPGAAWSFMADAPDTFRRVFFLGTSLLAILLIGVFLWRAEKTQRRLVLALSLVLSGAIGNLIDRINYGYVIDFIVWHVDKHYWPTFNVADAAISIGVALMAIELIFGFKEEAAAKADEKMASTDAEKSGDTVNQQASTASGDAAKS